MALAEKLGRDVVIEIPRLPWHGVEIPFGFELSLSGVSDVRPGKQGEPDKLEPIAGCVWLVGLTTGTAGDWGRLLRFQDHDDRVKELAIPAARLHEDPAILARELATLGLRIIPGKERRLVAYLASFDPQERIQSAPRLGWMDRTDGGLAFVFPDRVLSAAGNEQVVYQPERYSPTATTVHAAGSLEDWQANIAAKVAGSDVLLFALCAGFAPPWLRLADSDSFILHFWGTTSRGKTTIAQIAASVWGCAVDPAESAALSMIKRWNATSNGIEGLAEAHSDLVLCLDELGAGNTKDHAPLIYQLAGGQGKTAMSSDRSLKAPRAWRTVAISTGELSLEAKLSDGGKPPKGGLLHRALDIEVADIADHLPEGERRAFVEGLKRSCATCYGTAGVAMLQAMMQEFPSLQAAKAAAVGSINAALDKLRQPHHAPEQVRALRRLAMIAWAGIHAARHGVLPIAPARIWQAVANIAERWGSSTTGTDQDRILEAVRAFILKHGGRFQSVNGGGYDVPNRAGFRDASNGRWMFSPAALIEAAPGNDVVTIARAIQQAGHLFTSDTNLNAKVQTPLGRGRWYVVKDSIFDDSTGQPSKPLGQLGQIGQTAPQCGLEPALNAQTPLGQLGQQHQAAADSALVPYLQKTARADGNLHSDSPRPSALPALDKNSTTQDETDAEGF